MASLTFHKARPCWRKKHKGRTHYVGRGGVCKTDENAYRSALLEWEALRRHLDGDGPDPHCGGDFDPIAYDRRLGEFLGTRLLQALHAAQGPARAADLALTARASDYARLTISPKALRTPTGDIALSDSFAEYLRQRQRTVRQGSLRSM